MTRLLYSIKGNNTKVKANLKSDDCSNMFCKKILLNRYTHLPVEGKELVSEYTSDTLDYFESDKASVVNYNNLIICTICFKPIGNSFFTGGLYSWVIQWLVINPIDKYLKLILNRKDLYNEIENKNGNNNYFLREDLNKFTIAEKIQPSHLIFKIKISQNMDKDIKKYQKKTKENVYMFNKNVKITRKFKLGSQHLQKLKIIKDKINEITEN
tara:strand:+ start:660 stop:1295 length:636 start_codon:yes stop_codon:yes gene_type:complete